MSDAYWKAKIWGLLHDPALKALHNNSGRGGEGLWQELAIMQGWTSPKESGKKLLEWIASSDLISSASDRAAIGSLFTSVNYSERGLEISHLLSGAKLKNWKLPQQEHQSLIIQKSQRNEYIKNKEKQLIPDWIKQETTDYRQVFWWLWRCLPEATCRAFEDELLLLMPAETRIPDSSIWSHASVTAGLAGALAGYNLTTNDIESDWQRGRTLSRPYLATFSFSPIQELIKASRKMRDFWAGSWLLHYLSAKVCWDLAQIYGPDCFVYPSLFEQPLIDYWLLNKWDKFKQGQLIEPPSDRQLLTAGFPNVLVLILSKESVKAAMQTAHQSLKAEWQRLGKEVLNLLDDRDWMPALNDSSTWSGWLDAQWQTYWSAVPIGDENQELKDTGIFKDNKDWVEAQNKAYELKGDRELFLDKELAFLKATFGYKKPGVNIGSWWAYVFDRTRFTLTAAKNARNWQIPTAFGCRSTVSGLGSAVHPNNFSDRNDWVSEADVDKLWDNQVGLFDGIEKLNATEVLKRCLPRILSAVFPDKAAKWREASYYPDLSSGVAGWLRQSPTAITYYQNATADISNSFPWTKTGDEAPAKLPWGIPLAKEFPNLLNPRLLNPGWLIDDYQPPQNYTHTEKLQAKNNELKRLRQHIAGWFPPGDNPTDWYVIAAGDGDNMSQWLKGGLLKKYQDYVASTLIEQLPKNSDEQNPVKQTFAQFLQLKKRMGPSTHSALSRALLDFSNKLVPYLTEKRYAGRLIYSGGDDVLAYTNLWEWDSWLWDIRQCFKGAEDPHNQFDNSGDYWRGKDGEIPKNLSNRPLFTMGSTATISFGIAIAHHSVPLAIALENLWQAEAEAKEHFCDKIQPPAAKKKNAVQVRVIYGNGNILKATSKFAVFDRWRSLLNFNSAIFEQAASFWQQYPAPNATAIAAWTKAFSDRRDIFKTDDTKAEFQHKLTTFLDTLWQETGEKDFQFEVQNWLKLAAFVVRNRVIGNW